MHAFSLLGIALVAAPVMAFAQTDEIQVYDAQIAVLPAFALYDENGKTSKDQFPPGTINGWFYRRS